MNQNYRKPILASLFLVCFVTAVAAFLMQDKNIVRTTQSVESKLEADFYSKKIQPIFNNRCIACHSCLESPCQLNLQSFEGLQRGGIQNSLVYGGLRLNEVRLTRMFEDAQTTKEWRGMGFHDVIGEGENSILLQSVRLGLGNRTTPKDEVSENQFCAKKISDFSFPNSDVKMGMPYGMAPISKDQFNTLKEWVASGAAGPSEQESVIPPDFYKSKMAWEDFLNQDNLKTKYVARYLFEHMFLADFYLESTPRFFMKMIRSSTPCQQPKIISSRRPNESPGVAQWFYCFVPSRGVTVDKTHMPYNFSLKKLDWIKKNFMGIEWQPVGDLDYSLSVATNPFVSFKSIPESARYRFLLEDAFYHINTFIKGPVCNGTGAVNSIQEQFYTYFLSPGSDLMSLSSEHSRMVADQLLLPGKWGSTVDIGKLSADYKELVLSRNKYRQMRGAELKKYRPNGLTLNDIWDGDGTNDNASLTIIRHNNNARVVKGAFGDLSKTAFVLDYSLFERLVYNLVVNFDVYGSTSHQFLTRVYMDLIRMEAENNFLDFLPEKERLKIKKTWYEGFITDHKLTLLEEKQFSPIPAGITFTEPDNVKLEFVRKILFERMNERVRGPVDPINWKTLKSNLDQNNEEKELSRITSITGKFASRFPEVSILVITENTVPKRAYSIVRNRQLANVSWIMLEGTRLDPKQDTLMIRRGYLSSYPNQFFTVEKSGLNAMMSAALVINDQADFNAFLDKYGVQRVDPRIWTLYDFMTEDFLHLDPINAGYLDLSRYFLPISSQPDEK